MRLSRKMFSRIPTLVRSLIPRDDPVRAESIVQQYQAFDDAPASLKLNGELVGYDAPKRPAEKLVATGGIDGLEPVGIACRHAANRFGFSFAILWDLVDSDDRAIQMVAQSPI